MPFVIQLETPHLPDILSMAVPTLMKEAHSRVIPVA